jgi:hypothetical protein
MMDGKPKRMVAILLELDEDDNDFLKLRRFLKCILRSYGMKCISIREPSETVTFKSESQAKEDGRC